MQDLLIEREDGEQLVVQDPRVLAEAFFTSDPSSVGERAFDQLAGKGDPDRVLEADVNAINRTMRARSPYHAWAPILGHDAPWLAAIPMELDLLDTDDGRWAELGGEAQLRAAYRAVLGHRRGLAVATKLLHLKRPRLFPVLDSHVAQMLGVNVTPGRPSVEQLEIAERLTRAIRREGRRNLPALREVQASLREGGIDRPLVRILDALLWFSHPAAGLPEARRRIEVAVVPTGRDRH